VDGDLRHAMALSRIYHITGGPSTGVPASRKVRRRWNRRYDAALWLQWDRKLPKKCVRAPAIGPLARVELTLSLLLRTSPQARLESKIIFALRARISGAIPAVSPVSAEADRDAGSRHPPEETEEEIMGESLIDESTLEHAYQLYGGCPFSSEQGSRKARLLQARAIPGKTAESPVFLASADDKYIHRSAFTMAA